MRIWIRDTEHSTLYLRTPSSKLHICTQTATGQQRGRPARAAGKESPQKISDRVQWGKTTTTHRERVPKDRREEIYVCTHTHTDTQTQATPHTFTHSPSLSLSHTHTQLVTKRPSLNHSHKHRKTYRHTHIHSTKQ